MQDAPAPPPGEPSGPPGSPLPAGSPGSPAESVAPSRGSSQAPRAAADDQLAESLALDDAVANPLAPPPPVQGRHRPFAPLAPAGFEGDPPLPPPVDHG